MGPFDHYLRLVDVVEQWSERVTEAHGGLMACRRGCSGCCRQDLSVSRVEASLILSWLVEHGVPAHDPAKSEHDEHPLFDELIGDTPCVFLGTGGACGIYPVRPIICRTHGLPLRRSDDQVDCCPLNFPGQTLEMLPEQDLLDVSGLNVRVAVVERLFCEAEGSESVRIPLSELRAMALEMLQGA